MNKIWVLISVIVLFPLVLAINEGDIFFGDSGAAGQGKSANETIETVYFLQGSVPTVSAIVAAVVDNFNHYLYMFLVFIPLLLLIFGVKGDNPWVIMLAGILLTTFAIALYGGKFPNLSFETNIMNTAFAIMILGIGLYIIGKISIELSREAQI